MKNTNKKSGFTLVELAIVLVIIGLIVGGVLAGQDLIKAAELRAAVGQVEKMDTVVNAFRGKYNGIPGDIANPANFGFAASGLVSTQAGNAILDTSDLTDASLFNREPAAFMSHLATAQLINETLAATDFSTGAPATIANYVPASKLGKGIFFWAASNGGVNYYMLDNATLTAGDFTHAHSALTPITAYGMDTKLDDGVPNTGKVRAVLDVSAATTGIVAADQTACYDSSLTPAAYSTIAATDADAGRCALRIKAAF